MALLYWPIIPSSKKLLKLGYQDQGKGALHKRNKEDVLLWDNQFKQYIMGYFFQNQLNWKNHYSANCESVVHHTAVIFFSEKLFPCNL